MGQGQSRRQKAKQAANDAQNLYFGPRHVDNANYCAQCDRQFNSPKELEKHRMDDARHLVAKLNERRTFSRKRTTARTTAAAEERLNHCQVCDRYFTTEDELFHHISFEHQAVVKKPEKGKSSKRYEEELNHCSKCDRYFSTVAELQIHIETATEHHNMVFPEPDAKTSMPAEKALPPPEEFPYDCLDCGRKFATAISLSIHTSSAHFGLGRPDPPSPSNELPGYSEQGDTVEEPPDPADAAVSRQEPREIVHCPRCNALFSYRSQLSLHVAMCKGQSYNMYDKKSPDGPGGSSGAGPSSLPIAGPSGSSKVNPFADPPASPRFPQPMMSMPEPQLPPMRPPFPNHPQTWPLNTIEAPNGANVGASAGRRVSDGANGIGHAGGTTKQYECPLCLENAKSASNVPCGHVFCTECIRDVLIKDPRCPICRNPANLSDLRPVFL